MMPETQQRRATCHPDRPHYAQGQCQQCYRREHYSTAYVKERWGDRLPEYRARYEATVKARERRERYLRVRAAVGAVLGIKEPKLKRVFSSSSEVQRLRDALQEGDRTLAAVWLDVSPEQQTLLQQ
jgi:hypothetical protein